MASINVSLPNPKPDPMLKQLLRQFERIQQQLMTSKKHQSMEVGQLLRSVLRQQDRLVAALEHIMKQETRAPQSHGMRMNGMEKRLDVLTNAVRRSRNRTFGSNY